MSSHAYHRLYYHLGWMTQGARPIIPRTWRPKILKILADAVRQQGAIPIRRNAMRDHVHLAAKLPPKLIVADFIEAVKNATADRVNQQLRFLEPLVWEPGGGAVTFRSEQVDRISSYIDRQEQVHRSGRISDLLETLRVEHQSEGSDLFHRLFYHFTWATRRRETALRCGWRDQFLDILAEEAKKHAVQLIRHNLRADHVHMLVELPANLSVSEFIGRVKGSTGYRANAEIKNGFPLTWQEGYGVVSVGPNDLSTVSRYIENQEENERKKVSSIFLTRLRAF